MNFDSETLWSSNNNNTFKGNGLYINAQDEDFSLGDRFFYDKSTDEIGLSGWKGDGSKLYGGNTAGEYTGMQSGNGTTKAFFAGGDDSTGTNAKAYIQADGQSKFTESLTLAGSDAETIWKSRGFETTADGDLVQKEYILSETLAANGGSVTVFDTTGQTLTAYGYEITVLSRQGNNDSPVDYFKTLLANAVDNAGNWTDPAGNTSNLATITDSNWTGSTPSFDFVDGQLTVTNNNTTFSVDVTVKVKEMYANL